MRYASIVLVTSCVVYLAYTMIFYWEHVQLTTWMGCNFLVVLANQLLVQFFFKSNTKKILPMLISFLLVSISTVACIIGSIYYLYISPISFTEYRLVYMIFFLQVSCAHSTLSSAEFITKQRPRQNSEILI